MELLRRNNPIFVVAILRRDATHATVSRRSQKENEAAVAKINGVKLFARASPPAM
jgi:hypothetical protein